MGHVEAKRLGGSQVDHQLELRDCSTGSSANFAPCRILSPNSAVIALAGSDQDASRLWRSGRPNPTDKPHLFLAGRVRCHHNDLPFPRAKAEH